LVRYGDGVRELLTLGVKVEGGLIVTETPKLTATVLRINA
jgi:hypothetical protein